MLRRDRVRGVERATGVVDEDHPAAGVERRRGLVAPRGRDQQRVERELDPIGDGLVPDDQRDRAAGTVLGLGEQVDRDPRGIDGVVGDDRDLGRAREPVDADRAEDLALGLDDIRVARTDDHVDRPQRAGAERHRRDRLGAADRVHLVDLGDRRRGEDRVVDRARSGRAASTAPPSGTPATRAGSAVISTDDASGARPPGT